MEKTTIKISNLLRAGCCQEIEKQLKKNPYIKEANVGFVTESVTVVYDEQKINEQEIRELISDCGYQHVEKDEKPRMKHGKMSWWQRFKMNMAMTMDAEHGGDQAMMKSMEDSVRNRFIFSLILTIIIVLYSPLAINFLGLKLPSLIPVSWLLFILTTPVVVYGGWLFLYGSYRSLRNRVLNMSVLITIGVSAAYLFSVGLTVLGSQDTYYEAAAMLVTFVLFGHWLEMKSRRGTSEALRALFNLVPPKARVMRGNQEILLPTSEIKKEDIIVLKPGDKVPVDGEIIEGETLIDESLITGESMPLSKKVGDGVIGGSINQSGSVRFRATKIGKDTVLAQIVSLVEEAQNSKAPGQRLADKAAQYLVILAITAGLITFVIWYFILGNPLLLALTFAISVVVIACPDALGLATPTAVAVGTGLGAKHNILIKNAATLEQTAKIKAIVLDKTGTLTEGKPKITDVVAAPGFSENELIMFDAATEKKSNHPLSIAVLEEAKMRDIAIPDDIRNFEALAGHGVKATVEGKEVLVGTRKLMEKYNVNLEAVQLEFSRLLNEGKTLMIVAISGRVAGIIAAQDPIKPNAKRAVEYFNSLGIETAMITGDNQKTAEAVGRVLGIKRVFAEVLPEDKADYV
ncbi:MAG: heavy metal translocating P-type ATPase, partial [Candidatus Nealsonbacteria bacterium]|nr:heavy metal translocating P-type ATPase [Candidatus Nealsonbacteria bacterium]